MNDLTELKARLAALTGDRRVVMDFQAKNDPDLSSIVKRGQLYSEVGSRVKMTDAECHWNTAKLYKAGEIDSIVVGYARNSEGWHQHTWGLKDGKVVETTASNFKNTHWYGQPLAPKDADAFVKLTSENPPGQGMIRTFKGGAVAPSEPPALPTKEPGKVPTGLTLDGAKPAADPKKAPKAPKLSKGATANEVLLDSSLRHQVDLRRYSAGLTKRINGVLAEADAELADKLKVRLARFEGGDLDFTGERWKQLISEIREVRSSVLGEVHSTTRDELKSLSVIEGAAEVTALTEAVPILFDFATVSPEQLRAIVTDKPFQGKILKDWFQTLSTQDGARLIQAIQLGMTEGEPTPDIVRRITGTKAASYTDGILSITRRDAMTIARTAVNHVSNTAREYVWEENADVIQCRVWHSTLDGRTSSICRSRDGHASPIGYSELPAGFKPLIPPNARPPAHMNCRSVVVAFIDGDGLIGLRPFVTDTRTPQKREVDFRQEARDSGKDIKDIRKLWVSQNIGRVNASTTYGEFLARQSADFQDEVLGKTKGKLFRTGKIDIQEYTDRNGSELTLKQLALKKPEVFRAAKLDPEEFGDD